MKTSLRERWLINMSKSILSEEEVVLRLGLNFVHTPKTIPHMDHVTGVELTLKRAKLLLETSEEVRAKVCSVLKSAPKPEKNLAVSQLRGTT